MQLVNENVSILNPTKDNLILDPAGVEADPRRSSGARHRRHGPARRLPSTTSPARPASATKAPSNSSSSSAPSKPRSTAPTRSSAKPIANRYRTTATTFCSPKSSSPSTPACPSSYTLDAMRTQPPDNAACRELFSELEFTTLLKELAPAADNTPITYNTQAHRRRDRRTPRRSPRHRPGHRQAPRPRHRHLRRRPRHRRRDRRRTRSEESERTRTARPPRIMSLFGSAAAGADYRRRDCWHLRQPDARLPARPRRRLHTPPSRSRSTPPASSEALARPHASQRRPRPQGHPPRARSRTASRSPASATTSCC